MLVSMYECLNMNVCVYVRMRACIFICIYLYMCVCALTARLTTIAKTIIFQSNVLSSMHTQKYFSLMSVTWLAQGAVPEWQAKPIAWA